jgi:hypothetical protein
MPWQISTAASNGKTSQRIARNGGSKPGERRGGRKKGTPNKSTEETRELIARLAVPGLTPHQVMIGNMLWAIEQARLAAEAKDSAAEHRYRSFAQECAKDAAPYSHPRLASAEVRHSGTLTLETLETLVGASMESSVKHLGNEIAQPHHASH